MAENVTVSTNTVYGVATAITIAAGLAVGAVVYCTGKTVSGLEEKCKALEKKVEYLDSIVKERDSATKELFDAKLSNARKTTYDDYRTSRRFYYRDFYTK